MPSLGRNYVCVKQVFNEARHVTETDACKTYDIIDDNTTAVLVFCAMCSFCRCTYYVRVAIKENIYHVNSIFSGLLVQSPNAWLCWASDCG